MTTRRDLAEAYLFSRRRLVHALVSARDRDETGPPGSGGWLAGSLLLALLVLVGAVIDQDPGLLRRENAQLSHTR